MRERIRGQIVGYRQRRVDPLISWKIEARRGIRVRGIAVDDVAAVPVRRRVYLNRQIPGRVDLNRLVAESEGRRTVCGVIEPDALKPGEGRELVEAEAAVARTRWWVVRQTTLCTRRRRR